MNPAPRPHTAPALVAGCWTLSVLSGAALVAIGPTEPRPEPDSLSPYSLAAYLRGVADPDARQVRVNGLYGSGHAGAWQVTAHISWLDPTGGVQGGTTTLPQLAGTATLDTDLDTSRLQAEHDIGWSMQDLDAALDRLDGVSDPLAMLELEILPDGSGRVLSCRSASPGPATCQLASRDRDVRPTGGETLTDIPAGGALSIQRG